MNAELETTPMTRGRARRPGAGAPRTGGRRRRVPIHVLVVCHSAVGREALRSVLVQDEATTVTEATDPLEAATKSRRQRPDVVVLDLEMPHMDGVAFLREMMQEDPLPVVVCSGQNGDGSRRALEALEAGALDVIARPQLGERADLLEHGVLAGDAVRAAATARIGRRRTDALEAHPVTVRQASEPASNEERVVAIGASTGGTEALRQVLAPLPESMSGTLIVQHMPPGITAALAERLNEACAMEVKEAIDGDWVGRGRALVAPGGQHMRLRRGRHGYAVDVYDGPLVSRHRPSVDVLFESVAREAGPHGVAVVLAGMGGDGAQGTLDVRRSGGLTIAQDEATSVVFGMPKEAIESGGVEYVVSLSRIPEAILGATRPHPEGPAADSNQDRG